MAARNTEWVGNAWKYIGVSYQNRKSFPRNSQGFEPLEAYFPNKAVQDSDSDSDSSITEEMVQQEYQRLLKLKQAKLAMVEQKLPPNQSDQSKVSDLNENTLQLARPAEGRANTDSKGAAETVCSNSSKDANMEACELVENSDNTQAISVSQGIQQSKLNVSPCGIDKISTLSNTGSQNLSGRNSEYLYSPSKSVFEKSTSLLPGQKMHPSRLSFGGSSSDTDGNTQHTSPLSVVNRSTKSRKRRKTVLATSSKRRSSRNAKHVSISATTDSTTRQQSESASTAAGEISTSVSNSNVTVEPAKMSTQISLNRTKTKKSTGTNKQNSSTASRRVTSTTIDGTNTRQLYSLKSESDSEDDPDGVLKELLGGAMSRLQSLQAKVNVANSTPAEPDKVERMHQKRGEKESKMVADEEIVSATRKSNRRTVRKPQRNMQSSPSPPKAMSSISGVENNSNDLLHGAENDLLHGTVNNSHDSLLRAETGSHVSLHRTGNDLLPEAKVVDNKALNVQRESFLKVRNVSVVLTKPGSPSSVSHGSSTPSSSSPKQNQSKASKAKPVVKKTSTRARVKKNVVSDPVSTTSTVSSSGQSLSKVNQLELVKRTVPNIRRKRNDTSGGPLSTAKKTRAKQRTRKEADDKFPDPADLPAYEDNAVSHEAEQSVGRQTRRSSSVDVSVLPKIKARKRKKTARCVIPIKRRKSIPSSGKLLEKHTQSEPAYTDSHIDEESLSDSAYEGQDVTYSPGGRKYLRLKVTNDVAKTPDVRRSQRARIAPVRSWLNEKVDYEMRRRSGISMKGILVPMYDIDGEGVAKSRGRKVKQDVVEMVDNDFQKLEIIDDGDNVVDKIVVVKTVASASKIDSRGQAVDDSTEVTVSRLFSSELSTNGIVSFSPYSEKGRSASKAYEMYFYIMSGKVVFQINQQEFTVQPRTVVHVPAYSVYNIRNFHKNKAEVFYHTSTIPPNT